MPHEIDLDPHLDLARWTDEFSRAAFRAYAEREERRAALDRAVAGVPGERLVESLDAVMAALPLAISVETASIRLRDVDGGRALHHLSAVGVPTTDRRRLRVAPLSVARARAIMALGARHSLARDLGLRWFQGVWLEGEDGERIGTLFVGSRTDRQPDADELDVLHDTAAALSERLSEVDRTTNALRRLTTEVAQSLLADQTVGADPVLAGLRMRERAILELYADGMTTAEIAELLVLSEHTVRTHVKNALRRLGLHSREDAVDLVRRARVYQLV